MLENQRFIRSKKCMKVFAYLFVFVVTLSAGVVSKISFVLMVGQISADVNTTYCDYKCKYLHIQYRCTDIMYQEMYYQHW